MKQVALFLLLVFTVTVRSCPDHDIEIYNNCPFAVWPAVHSPIQPNTNNGFKLDPYQARTIRVPCKWEAARVWARTDCDGSGRNCLTGDCGQMSCTGAGQPDVSLAEFTLDGGKNGGNDFYDISAVDGYNLPISIKPINGGKVGSGLPPKYDCEQSMCQYDFRNNCDDQLKEIKNGRPVACLSACTKFNTDWFCCRGAFGTPGTCQAKNHPLVRFFKNKCPDMYSFAYDDDKSTYSCQGNRGTKYVVSFCP